MNGLTELCQHEVKTINNPKYYFMKFSFQHGTLSHGLRFRFVYSEQFCGIREISK